MTTQAQSQDSNSDTETNVSAVNPAQNGKNTSFKPQKKKGFNILDAANAAASEAKGKLSGVLGEQGDLQTGTAAKLIESGEIGVKLFKTAQNLSPYVIKTAKGTYKFGKTTVKIVKTIDGTIANIKSGVIVLNGRTLSQFRDFVFDKTKNKIKSAKTVQNITKAINKIKKDAAVKRVMVNINTGMIKAVIITRGILDGSTKIRITKADLKNFKDTSFRFMKKTATFTGKAAVIGLKQGYKVSRFSVKYGWKGINKLSGKLNASGDIGAQAISLSINAANYAIAGVKTAPRVFRSAGRTIKTVVNIPIKTSKAGKKVVKEVKRLKNDGVKKTAKRYGEKAAQAVEKAGRSAVSALVQLAQKAGAKFVLPVILLAFFFVAIFNIITASVAGIAAIFGNVFSIFDDSTGTYTDYEVKDFVKEAIISKRTEYADKIAEIRNNNLAPAGRYHYIRLFTDNNNTPIDIRYMNSDIYDYIYTEDEFAYMIEPIFNTIVLAKYGLEPTREQADAIVDEICDLLMEIKTEELPTEYCHDGEVHYDCGEIMADAATCPNYIHGYHYVYTCSLCCWVQGHTEWEYDDVNNEYYEVYWEIDECNGYYHCGGHEVLGVYQTPAVDGMYELLIKYFLKPIDKLFDKSARTDAEEEELQSLIDNYDLCLVYMENVQEHYGINTGSPDISDVVFLPGTRPGNAGMVSVAKMQVGKSANSIYWSWQGIAEREEWSASFVSWAAHSNGYITSGVFPNFSSIESGMNWFKNNSLWQKRKDYSTPVAGDIIFISWAGNNTADRCGVVMGNDGEFVYVIEGNNGDYCRIRSYSLKSSMIIGYGLPNY